MSNLLNIGFRGLMSEIVFYLVVAVILLPFAIIDFVILRKMSSLNPSTQTSSLKKFKRIKIIVAVLVMIVFAVSGGCLMQFVLHIDLLEDDMRALALFVLTISVFAITLCIFDLIRYFKLKKHS